MDESDRAVREKARTARRRGAGAPQTDLVDGPYRADRDRVASSPFFSRLAGVTQVVSPSGSGLLLHNRLTHSLRVAQVARAIVAQLDADPGHTALLAELGGCDPDVVEAAALAHDLGHPPFGHLGEQALDRIARHRFGLADGFEGNAQSFRIITTTDSRSPSGTGLELTAAVRAAVLKYPWTRHYLPRPHPSELPQPPRGAGEPADARGTGSAKFAAYVTELDDLVHCRAAFEPTLQPWQQTVEASIMDTADDIAYAIHDLEDFHRVGVLQHAAVATELGTWLGAAGGFAALDAGTVQDRARRPGYALEALRRRLLAKDSWVYDDDAFVETVRLVRAELVDGLLAVPFDGSIEAEQAVSVFSGRWAKRLVNGVLVRADPPVRSGHVLLNTTAWHEVQVLKFVHSRFVLLRADLALQQRGQAQLLTSLVESLDAWLSDRSEYDRIPRRLHELVELAEAEYSALAGSDPEALRGTEPLDSDGVRRLARGRAVIDFLAALTDSQAIALLDALSGRTGQLWSETFVL